MKRRLIATLFFSLCVSVIPACSSAPTAPGAATSSPGAANTPAAARPSAVATAAPKASSAQVVPAVPFPKSGGLDPLDSYTLSFSNVFKGTRDGQALNTSELYTRTFSLNPSAQFTLIQKTDETGEATTLIQGLIGDVQYLRLGLDQPCTARTTSSANPQVLNPGVMLKPILQGKDAGQETVNGAPARHYVMDPIQKSNTQVSGEVWIADPGGFVAKYAMLIKGGEEYFGAGTLGEQTLRWELRDVGAKKVVALPGGCPPPVTDLPAMADAANLTRSLLQLSYTTVSGLAKTETFYQDQMKSLGWTLESRASTPDLSQAPAGGGMIPNLPGLPQLPGVNLGQYLPTSAPNPAAGPPGPQDSWMVFALANEQRRAVVTLRPEGTNVRVQVQIVQD